MDIYFWYDYKNLEIIIMKHITNQSYVDAKKSLSFFESISQFSISKVYFDCETIV